MSDARQELHQRSLRNVRALLEKEREEFERQKRSKRLLVWAAIPLVALVAGLVWYGAMKRPASREESERTRVACEVDMLAAKSGEVERSIRAAHPGMAPADVAQLLQRESAALQAAAASECRRKLGK